MRRARRVAIIGIDGFQRSDRIAEIECFPWNRVTNISNPSDYDAIVFNLISLTDLGTVNWDGFFDRFTELTTLEVLANGGSIVILGDPRSETNEAIPLPGGKEVPGREFLMWTGMRFDWDEKPGKTKNLVECDPSTKTYFNYTEKISHWDYCLKDVVWSNDFLRILPRVLGKSATGFSSNLQLERICENRYGGLIVFAIKLLITDKVLHPEGPYVHRNKREGRVVFLPQIDMSQDEIVAMILKDIVGVQVVVPEPAWASAIVAPLQPPIDAKITALMRNIKSLEVELTNAEKERESARHCVHLLYKLGDELEDAVRDVLGSLGSTIEPPSERGKEDGWITVEIESETFEGVLEIKGTRKDQFSLDGLRQLMEWKRRGILNRNKKYKGIFIGNSGAEKEVSKRKAPFANSWTETAKLDEIIALDTRDLYTLYCLHRDRKLDNNQFWRVLFRTNGVFSLDSLNQPATRTKQDHSSEPAEILES